MKILVTGANGYIGRHVVPCLLDYGHEVIACDINIEGVDPRATSVSMNLFEHTYNNIFERLHCPDACIHFAWRNGFVHNSTTHMGDLSSHYMFMTSLMEQGLKQIVVMGSMHEVGYWEGMIKENTPCNPLSQYAIAKDALKRSLQLYCKTNNIVFQWLRGYYIVGDDKHNHSIFAKIIEAEEQGKATFPFTSGKIKYDFIDVNELACQITAVASQQTVTGIIDCCSGNPVSLGEKVESFIKENGFKIRLDYGAFPDRPYDSPIIYGDTSKIKSIIER